MADLSHLNSSNKKIDLSHLNSSASIADNDEEEKPYGESPFERGPVQLAMHIPKVITKDILNFVKEQGLPALSQILTNPKRAAKNVIAGPLVGISNIPNIPSAIPSYLNHLGIINKEMLERANKRGAIIPHGEYDAPVKKLFGLEEEEVGDKLLQAVAPFGPHIAKGAKAAYKSLSPGNKLQISHVNNLRNQLANNNLSLKEIADAHEKQIAAESAAKDASIREVGASEPNSMFNQLGKKENALEEAKRNLSLKQGEAEQHAGLPEIPEINTEEPAKNVTNAENALMQSHEDVLNLEAEHNAAKIALENHESKVGEFLHAGKAHHVHVGEFYKNYFENNHKKLKADYKEAADAISESKVKMPKTKEEKGVIDMDAVLEKARSGKIGLSEGEAANIPANPVLDHLLSQAPTSRITDAGKFMIKYRDFKKSIFDASQRMKFTDSAQERSHIAEALPKARKVLGVAKKALEEGIGAEHAEAFAALNKRYEQHYNLRENPTMRYARKHGKISGNMIEKLSGSGVGQDQIRAIAKSNPEIVKHILGQTYESGAGKAKIHNPGELVSEWTKELPQLQSLTQKRANLQGNVERVRSNIERQKQRHEGIIAAHKEAVGKAKESEKEAASRQKEKSYREAATYKFNEEIEDARSDIKSQEVEIDKYRKNYELVDKESKKTDITLKKKTQIENEKKDLKEKIAEAKRNVEKSKGSLYRKISKGYRVVKGAARMLGKLGS